MEAFVLVVIIGGSERSTQSGIRGAREGHWDRNPPVALSTSLINAFCYGVSDKDGTELGSFELVGANLRRSN